MRPSRQARLQFSGMGPVEPLTRVPKEAVTRAAATARVVSAERMKDLLLAGILIHDGHPALNS
jgi:hypothetical protein